MMLKLLKRLLKDLSVSLVGILLVIACILIVAGLVLFGYSRLPGKTHAVVSSLGKYADRVFYTSGGFQDFTDYAKYYFTAADIVENKHLNKIQETDFAMINAHLDDFEGWIDTIKDSDPSDEVVVNYDFNRGMVDTEDYFYIDSEEHTWSDGDTSLVRYDIYLFDAQTQILYYFHNNI